MRRKNESTLDVERSVGRYEIDGLMCDLKPIGSHNVGHPRLRGLVGMTRLGSDVHAGKIRHDEGRLLSTWEVFHVHAWEVPTA
jgi:malonyl-CoA O-methyltransferase